MSLMRKSQTAPGAGFSRPAQPAGGARPAQSGAAASTVASAPRFGNAIRPPSPQQAKAAGDLWSNPRRAAGSAFVRPSAKDKRPQEATSRDIEFLTVEHRNSSSTVPIVVSTPVAAQHTRGNSDYDFESGLIFVPMHTQSPVPVPATTTTTAGFTPMRPTRPQVLKSNNFTSALQQVPVAAARPRSQSLDLEKSPGTSSPVFALKSAQLDALWDAPPPRGHLPAKPPSPSVDAVQPLDALTAFVTSGDTSKLNFDSLDSIERILARAKDALRSQQLQRRTPTASAFSSSSPPPPPRKDSDSELFNLGDWDDMSHISRNRRTNSQDGARAPNLKMFDSNARPPSDPPSPQLAPADSGGGGARLKKPLSPGGLLFGSSVASVPAPQTRLLHAQQASTLSPDLTLSADLISPRSAFHKTARSTLEAAPMVESE